MLVQMAMLMQASVLPPTDAAGNRTDWISLPSARMIAECVHSTMPRVDVVLVCTTVKDDRLEACAPAADLPPPPPNVARFAVCTAKAYRVRSVGPDGKPVVGVTVRIPVRLLTPIS